MKGKVLHFILAVALLSACGAATPGKRGNDPLASSNAVKAIRWNEQVDADLRETLGEFAEKLPRLEANSYESRNETLSSGVSYTRIICYSEDSEEQAKLYKVGLKVDGWSVETDGNTNTASLRVAFDTFLLVAFLADNPNGKSAVTVAAWLYHDKISEFPNDKVLAFCGHELPVLEADFYTFANGNLYGIDVLEVTCYGVEKSAYEEYLETLKEEGWDIQAYYSSYSGYQESWDLYNQLTYYDVETATAGGIETDRPVALIDVYKK